MNASELFKDNKLGAAIDAQLAAVKAHPTDANRRLFLFELAMFAGDLERATKQGVLVKFDDVELNTTMDGYRLLVEAEKMRRRVLHDGESPKSFGPLSEECQQRVQALMRLREGRATEAAEITARFPPPVISGTLNGKRFDGLCDCDDLLAPMLEVVSNQGYFWVPLAQIRSLKTTAPKFPRDLYWLPAHLELADGQSGPTFLSALYVDSYQHADDAVKIGRQTDWVGQDGEPVRGRGQKTFLVGDDPIGLLDIRELTVND